MGDTDDTDETSVPTVLILVLVYLTPSCFFPSSLSEDWPGREVHELIRDRYPPSLEIQRAAPKVTYQRKPSNHHLTKGHETLIVIIRPIAARANRSLTTGNGQRARALLSRWVRSSV
jgi:hypothetical protein